MIHKFAHFAAWTLNNPWTLGPHVYGTGVRPHSRNVGSSQIRMGTLGTI